MRYIEMVPKSTGPEWLSTVEAHEMVGVTLRTLYRLIDEGHIPAYKFGRVIRLRRGDVDAYINQARIKPGELRHLYPHDKDDA